MTIRAHTLTTLNSRIYADHADRSLIGPCLLNIDVVAIIESVTLPLPLDTTPPPPLTSSLFTCPTEAAAKRNLKIYEYHTDFGFDPEGDWLEDPLSPSLRSLPSSSVAATVASFTRLKDARRSASGSAERHPSSAIMDGPNDNDDDRVKGREKGSAWGGWEGQWVE